MIFLIYPNSKFLFLLFSSKRPISQKISGLWSYSYVLFWRNQDYLTEVGVLIRVKIKIKVDLGNKALLFAADIGCIVSIIFSQ